MNNIASASDVLALYPPSTGNLAGPSPAAGMRARPALSREGLRRLRCPYTASPYSIVLPTYDTVASIEYGVIESEAGKFPIVAGVVRLLADDLTAPLVQLVEQGRHDVALLTALEVPFLNHRGTVMNTLWRRTARKWGLAAHAYSRGPHKRQWYRLLTRPDLTFMQLAAQAKAEAWGNWQTYRFSMPTFLAAHALAHLAQGCRAILDFGCGIGHSAFLMRRVAPQALMVCADRSFTSLYLAQRFMVPDALAVCLDGNYSLPFDRDQFDLVFSTDALQYIDAKRNLAREFQRVLDPDGTIALAHLHNRLSAPGGCTGKGLTARGYQGLFDGMERRVYAEEQLVDDYVVDGALRLDRITEAGELDAKQCSVSLVAANTQSVFRAHAGISDAHIDAMRHPLLNPVYRASGAGTSWTLDRTVAAPYAIERTFRECDILPQRCSVSTGSLDRAGLLAMREADPAQMRDLARRFVILDMPEFYA